MKLPPFHFSTHGKNTTNPSAGSVLSLRILLNTALLAGGANQLAWATTAARFRSNVIMVRCLFRSKPVGLLDYLPSRHWLHEVVFQGFLPIPLHPYLPLFLQLDYVGFPNITPCFLSIPLSMPQLPLRICCLRSPICPNSYPSPGSI